MSKKDLTKKDFFDKIKNTLDKIEINIYTNIDNGKNNPILFTRNLFAKQPDNIIGELEDHPFFTTEYRIPYKVLKGKLKEDIFNILFNKNKFTKFLYEMSPTTIGASNQESYDENVKTLLKLLFPTYYPIKDNYTDTYNELIKEVPPAIDDVSLSLPSFSIPSFFKNLSNTSPPGNKIQEKLPPKFTYLTIGGKTYTVLKVVYLNDFINNPKYNKVITTFKEYEELKKTFGEKTKWLESDIQKEIVSKMIELIIEMNLPANICKYYSSIISQYSYDANYIKKNFGSDAYNTAITNNRTIKEVDELFNKTIFNNKSTNNLFEKSSYNIYKDENCIGNYINNDEESINDDNKVRSLTSKDINGYNGNNASLKKLKQDINTFNNTIVELNKHINNIKNHSIYNKIIRGKTLLSHDKIVYDNYTNYINNEYKKYYDFLKGINPIFTNESKGSFNFSSVFTSKFSKISKLFSEIKSYEGVENYIKNGTISSEQFNDYIKKEYPKLIEFKELIKTFTYPNRESYNETFSDMVINSIQSTKQTTQTEELIPDPFIPFLTGITTNSLPDDKELLHTGIDLYYTPVSGKSKYEIQVYMDLVEGELTEDILTKTDCFFKDNKLVDVFYKLKDSDIVTNKYVFNSKLPVLKIPDISTSLPSKKNILPISNGGKKQNITRKYKKHRRLARKLSRRRVVNY